MPEGIDINKTGDTRVCIICHYRYLLRIDFRFQPKVWDGCHDVTQKCMSLDDAVIVTVKGHGYKTNFWLITKNEAVDIMKRLNNKGTMKETEKAD